jgi:hypothetical protein
MIVKTSIGFLTTDNDGELIVHVQHALDGTTGNASYPKAQALVALIKVALQAFIDAEAAASNGGTDLTQIKKQKRAALCALLRTLAADINEECQGNFAVLLTSKFPYQKPEHQPVGNLPTPAAPLLALGAHSGELDASVAPIGGALTYNWRLALASAPTVILQTDETSASFTTFAGLTPGQIYLVQVNAVGTAGTTDWSPAATLMVV